MPEARLQRRPPSKRWSRATRTSSRKTPASPTKPTPVGRGSSPANLIAAPDASPGNLASALREGGGASAGSAVASSLRKSACRARPAPICDRCYALENSGNPGIRTRMGDGAFTEQRGLLRTASASPGEGASRYGSSSPETTRIPRCARRSRARSVVSRDAWRGPCTSWFRSSRSRTPSIARPSSPNGGRSSASPPWCRSRLAPDGSWKISCARRTRRTARTSSSSTPSCAGPRKAGAAGHARPRSARREGPASARRGAQEQRPSSTTSRACGGSKRSSGRTPGLLSTSSYPASQGRRFLVDALLAFTRGGFLRFGLLAAARSDVRCCTRSPCCSCRGRWCSASHPRSAGSVARSSNRPGPPSTSS